MWQFYPRNFDDWLVSKSNWMTKLNEGVSLVWSFA